MPACDRLPLRGVCSTRIRWPVAVSTPDFAAPNVQYGESPAYTQAKDRSEILAHSSQGDTERVGIEELEPVHRQMLFVRSRHERADRWPPLSDL